jgi:hypothetical protein
MMESHVFPYDRNAPSVKERITALSDHCEQFQMIAEYPQANIHQRFGKEWALVSSYVESKIYECGRAAVSLLRENAQPGRVGENEAELRSKYEGIMDDLANALLLQSK